MARPLRIEFPGALYHITARGNAGADIYLSDRDRTLFLEVLGAVCERFGWRCPSYCLMTNHYHLVIETPEGDLSRGMRQLNGVYTQRFNRTHGRQGHVFQGRYHAVLVDRDAYFKTLCRYVVLNPVRAGLVRRPERWRWSSYRATIGSAPVPVWLDADALLEQFARSRRIARAAYRDFVRDGVGATDPWQDLRGQIYLGSEQFVAAMQARADMASDMAEVPKVQRRRQHHSISWFEAADQDRHRAMARAYLVGGHTLSAIARYFGVHYSTVSRAVRRLEAEGSGF